MSEFTKTVIVDPTETGYPHTIQDGINEIWDPPTVTACGVVIVEQGVYEISSESDIVKIPSNVTLIGRGNVIVKINGDFTAFQNFDQANGNSRIRISGFKIVVGEAAQQPYNSDVIYMKNVSDSIIEKLTITSEEGEYAKGIYPVSYTHLTLPTN